LSGSAVKKTGESSRTHQSRMNVEVQFELVSCNLQRGGGRRGGLNRRIVVSRYGRQATDRVVSSMGVLVWIGGLRFQDRGSCLRPRRGLLTAYLETHCCYDSVWATGGGANSKAASSIARIGLGGPKQTILRHCEGRKHCSDEF
jgi:hypothetical protein